VQLLSCEDDYDWIVVKIQQNKFLFSLGKVYKYFCSVNQTSKTSGIRKRDNYRKKLLKHDLVSLKKVFKFEQGRRQKIFRGGGGNGETRPRNSTNKPPSTLKTTLEVLCMKIQGKACLPLFPLYPTPMNLKHDLVSLKKVLTIMFKISCSLSKTLYCHRLPPVA